MITARLQCILNYSQAKVIADIGTDHAYIPIALINEGRAEYVIASDVNSGPLEIAKGNIAENNLSEKIETRQGSGLSVLTPGEAEQIIIAGMGGELIQKIIESDLETAYASELLLQPMNAQAELRKYLLTHGFSILTEDIAVEGFKVYNFIKAVKGNGKPFTSEIDYHLPPYLKENKFYSQLYAKKRREFEKIVNGLERAQFKDEADLSKLKYYKNLLTDNSKAL